MGINSFSAYFSDTLIPSAGWSNNLAISNYTPQVQINTMVIDTQHWVQLVDTFTYEGNGANYICLGNFKTDAQLQWQLVDSIRNLPIAAYYFYDDVSLVDLDTSASGVNATPLVAVDGFSLYPNPTDNEVTIAFKDLPNNCKLQFINTMGMVVDQINVNGQTGQQQIDVSKYSAGLYLCTIINSSGTIIKQSKLNIIGH